MFSPGRPLDWRLGQGPYLQHFIFFEIYEWAQQVRVLATGTFFQSSVMERSSLLSHTFSRVSHLLGPYSQIFENYKKLIGTNDLAYYVLTLVIM